MDNVTRKDILDRILLLNKRTFAIKDKPHRIDALEVEKREKKVKFLRLIFITLTGLYLLIVIAAIALPQSSLEEFLNEHMSFWIFLLLVLIMKTMNLSVKSALLSEQKFLVDLLNKSNPETND
jgi:hypothetical protein